jgi:hypothetical protein
VVESQILANKGDRDITGKFFLDAHDKITVRIINKSGETHNVMMFPHVSEKLQ